PARVVDLDECDAFGKRRRRGPFGHHGRSPRRERLRDEIESVVLRACHRHEQIAALDGAAVRADAGKVERGEARLADGIHGEKGGKLDGGSGPSPLAGAYRRGMRTFSPPPTPAPLPPAASANPGPLARG